MCYEFFGGLKECHLHKNLESSGLDEAVNF